MGSKRARSQPLLLVANEEEKEEEEVPRSKEGTPPYIHPPLDAFTDNFRHSQRKPGVHGSEGLSSLNSLPFFTLARPDGSVRTELGRCLVVFFFERFTLFGEGSALPGRYTVFTAERRGARGLSWRFLALGGE